MNNTKVNANIKSVISEVLVLLFSSEKREPIEKSLNLLLNFFGTDWIYVAHIDKEKQIVNFLYDAQSNWVVPEDDTAKLSFESFPWIIDTVLGGSDIILNDIDDLPPEAATDKVLLLKQHLKSMLMIPVLLNGEVQGLIGFDSIRIKRCWTSHEVEDLHIIANIFSIIIEREQVRANIHESQVHVKLSETKFNMFFENLPLGAELYDANGYLIDLNDADVEIFGMHKKDLIGINLFDNPNLDDEIISAILREKDFSFPIEYKFNKVVAQNYYRTDKVGDVKYLQIKGLSLNDDVVGHIGYLIIISDNTENYLRIEQTEKNLAKLKAALLSGRSVIGEYDAEVDIFKLDPLLNENLGKDSIFASIKDISFTYKQIIDFLPEDDWKHSKFQLFTDILEGHKYSGSITYRKSYEDRVVWIRVNLQTFKRTPEGKLSKVICYITNVTDEMEMASRLHETEIKARETELEMLKAREADILKSSFLANMSHEIRTPLNAIVGFSSIIAETDNQEERRAYLNIINKNNDLLLQLISDILDFSKIESGILDYHLTEVDVKELCAEIYIVNVLKISSEVCFIFDKEHLPEITIKTDAKRVTQVISNFLSNAIKFTRQGSITLSYKIEGEYIRFSVKDTGIGIPEQFHQTVFDRFVKINDFKQGTGLGLAICKTIIETLNGSIGLNSIPDNGSEFWFTLPVNSAINNGVFC